uniref:Lipase n=1 Tax=Acrobeloides nanus TaxID=290746 RepID=A0A914CZN3_9BILA
MSLIFRNGYAQDDFVRADLGNAGSYGGRKNSSDKIAKEPVIFIHGNSDSALNSKSTGGIMSIATGWTNSINYFLSKGYQSRELYATSWGNTNAMEASQRIHDCATLTRLRRFLEAVLAYTNATKIDIIAHSMGVTLGRKLVQGGLVTGGNCDLGKSLESYVDTFVGLAGANYGLCNCMGGSQQTCNKQNGFWPGDSCGQNLYTCSINPPLYPCSNPTYSAYLTSLNNNPIKIASYIYSAWSQDDDLIMFKDLVWGRPTSLIPNSTAQKVYSKLTHMQTKENTAADQYNMVVQHTI